MPYLKIENDGESDINAFLLFGATSKRESTNPLTLGTFGSGSKHGISTLLRASMNPIIFCGNTRLEFGLKPITISGIEHLQVVCNISGKLNGTAVKRTQDLGFTLAYGGSDWTHISMALREFISNALDGQMDANNGDFSGVLIEQCEPAQVRAKVNKTRVFIEINDDVRRFHRNIGELFLHFSDPDTVKNHKTIINKSSSGRAKIYRRGVFVRQIEDGADSIFDYNIEIPINESRNFSDYGAKSYAAKAVASSDKDTIAYLLRSMGNSGKPVWEASFSQYELFNAYSTDNSKHKINWQEAAKAVLGDTGVVCKKTNDGLMSDIVKKKGLTPFILPDSWAEAMFSYETRSEKNVLTEDDKLGRVYSDASDVVKNEHDRFWNFLVSEGLTLNDRRPNVKAFYQNSNAGGMTPGFYDKDSHTCCYHTDLDGDGKSEMLTTTAIEECVHAAFGCNDCTRDMQNAFTTIIARLIKGKD